ncbi:MAG: hypothetical protein SPE32_09330 [Mitsuokella sp.]|nr:hypothetical protein [Mitsuokella sp.]
MSRMKKSWGRRFQDQAAQGIVEYALILAFVVGVAAALFANGGLADAIGEAYFQVSETISNAINGSNEAKQQRIQDRLDKALREAIKNGNIVMDKDAWIEIDVQQEKNKKNGNYVDGGSSAAAKSSSVKVNGQKYMDAGGFESLWRATSLKMYEMNIEQESGWAGVRIVSNGNGSYTSYYYRGDASTVKGQNQDYANTSSMNAAARNDGTPLKVWEDTWTK